MENFLVITEIQVLILSILATIIYFSLLKFKKPSKNVAKAGILIFISFIISLCVLYYFKTIFEPNHLFMTIFILFCVACIAILKLLKVYTPKIGLIFTFLIITVVALSYNCYSPYWSRQHDSRSFDSPENGGHFGYIGYIFNNNKLPSGSPIGIWCFYNPPLFYIISTIAMKIVVAIKDSVDIGFEVIQLLSFAYTVIFNIYVYRILKEINIKKSIIPLLFFVGLSPAMIIMSGSINNDILSIALSTMAIYYTIVWYKDDSLKNLIKIALTISLAIMTKISAALIAVGIAVVFLTKIIKNRKNFIKYLKDFTIFALIALPIGLWFPIKNLVLYDVPITYVQSVDESNSANISKYSAFDRFFKINDNHLETININMSAENAEYNLYTTTLKSFIIDEHIEYEENKILKLVIPAIFYVSMVISIVYPISIIYSLINREKLNKWMYFFLLIGILQIGSYINFCFGFPFTFTMNFRYIVPSLITYCVITGIVSDKNKVLFYINTVLISIFSCLSILIFANLI